MNKSEKEMLQEMKDAGCRIEVNSNGYELNFFYNLQGEQYVHTKYSIKELYEFFQWCIKRPEEKARIDKELNERKALVESVFGGN